jgi:quercetin dioxygenase-like cupin family protein
MKRHESMSVQTRSVRQSMLLSAGLAVIAAIIGSLLISQIAGATPPAGLSATPIASGALSETQQVKFKGHHGGFGKGTEVSTISIVRYEIEPGGSFGWHQHGGPLWVVVAEGTLTFYGAQTGCAGRAHPAGSAFIDPGDMTHTARNEGSENLVIYVTFMLPEGAPARIDMPNPGVCPF